MERQLMKYLPKLELLQIRSVSENQVDLLQDAVHDVSTCNVYQIQYSAS